jgi:hypothetical protein
MPTVRNISQIVRRKYLYTFIYNKKIKKWHSIFTMFVVLNRLKKQVGKWVLGCERNGSGNIHTYIHIVRACAIFATRATPLHRQDYEHSSILATCLNLTEDM